MKITFKETRVAAEDAMGHYHRRWLEGVTYDVRDEFARIMVDLDYAYQGEKKVVKKRTTKRTKPAENKAITAYEDKS